MPLSILVVDDDPLSGGLSRELLVEAGYDAEHIANSLQAFEAIRRKRYAVVILDILMPGMDGLTLCHKIKSDPALRDTRVIMVSGKSFETEKKRAAQYGADLFIDKPYDIKTFAARIKEVLDRAPMIVPAPPTPPIGSTASGLEAAAWGTRSASLDRPSRYGRHSPCVSLDVGRRVILFDAGTGLAGAGDQIIARGLTKEVWLFMTHFHPAHVAGLAAFPCARRADFLIHVCGAGEPDRGLETLVESSFERAAAPIQARFELHEMLEDAYELGDGLRVASFYANHPGTTLGFSLTTRGKKLVYCADSELYGDATALQDYDEKVGQLCAGADLVVHDGRYTPEDYATAKNHGHSSFASAVDMAGGVGAKRLWLIHQDVKYDDAQLDRMSADAARYTAEKGYAINVDLAREGARIGL